MTLEIKTFQLRLSAILPRSSSWFESPKKFCRTVGFPTEREESSREWCPYNLLSESAWRVPFFLHQKRRAVLLQRCQWASYKLGIEEYKPEEWSLFIDSSKRSLICVLLHNGNLYGSVPLAHSTTLKEKYEEIKLVLEKILIMIINGSSALT